MYVFLKNVLYLVGLIIFIISIFNYYYYFLYDDILGKVLFFIIVDNCVFFEWKVVLLRQVNLSEGLVFL